MVEKAEEFYAWAVDRLIRGQTYGSCAQALNDFLLQKYRKNTSYHHQALINLLYSLAKLRQNNPDIDFLHRLIVEELGWEQFVAFLVLREIFQTVTKISIIGKLYSPEHGKLKADPLRILVTPEVGSEMSSSLFRHSPESLSAAQNSLEELSAPGGDPIPYYSLMGGLLGCVGTTGPSSLETLQTLFQPNGQKAWDYNIGFPEGEEQEKVQSPLSWKASPGKPQAQAEGYQSESYRLTSPPRPEASPERSMGIGKTFPQSTGLEREGDLAIRRSMSTLIGKFIEAILGDRGREVEAAKTKMHAIVNRKCQNLLTTVFAGDKTKFMRLLMVAGEGHKDAVAVDEAFSRYDRLRESEKNPPEKLTQEFLKGILKIEYLASQISNLIMYSTTPIEEIIKYR